jgi:hypothetical protein
MEDNYPFKFTLVYRDIFVHLVDKKKLFVLGTLWVLDVDAEIVPSLREGGHD